MILIKASFVNETMLNTYQKMRKSSYTLFALLFLCSISATAQKRIIALGGAITETIDALGFGAQLVAVDVTSTYPAYVTKLPKVSQNRTVSTEGVISFNPDLVIAPEGALSKATESQLKSAGIRVLVIKQEFSKPGALAFIRQIANALGSPAKGEELAKQTDVAVNNALTKVKQNPKSPKVLFIYARGTGVMMVAGKDTNIDAIIKLAGGKNAAQGFSKFKPYTTEALVNANPDIILMFDFGYKSLGGAASILKMPGLSLTNAGKNKRIVEMDGELLVNFSTRLAQAITQLNDKW